MPIPSPFHARTSTSSRSHEWRDWSGYLAASLYEPTHEHEYYAIRNAAALIDVSPLFKYEIRGPEAPQVLDRIMTRAVSPSAVGQVLYSPWCDDEGKLIDDGTITRLDEDLFRLTSADPNLAWFEDCAYGMQAEVRDVSTQLAALAVQGPNARAVLKAALTDIDLDGLPYYHAASARIGDTPLTVTRTGYTGDLGYELWLRPEAALHLWDALIEAGYGYGIAPAGMLALDIARIEAGLVMIQVDYISARLALIAAQKSSPYELGLGWTVDLDKPAFVGRQALLAEHNNGSPWLLVGVRVDWDSLESLYAEVDLYPSLAGRASRQAVPVYRLGRQVGQMTSHTFSPLLKNYIGLASIERKYAHIGDQVEVEFTIEYARKRARASLVKLPFFNPPRKRA